MYFSINPAMLSTNKGRQTIAVLPAGRILTESDGPFAKAKGREAGPGDISWLVTELAKGGAPTLRAHER